MVFQDTFPPSDTWTSRGMITDPSGMQYWGVDPQRLAKSGVSVTLKGGQLTFRNTVNDALDALAFRGNYKIWKDDGVACFSGAFTAGAGSNTSDKTHVEGATFGSLSPSFYESALWTTEDGVDPSSSGAALVKELRAK